MLHPVDSLFAFAFKRIDAEQYQASLKVEDEKLKNEMDVVKKVVEKRRPGRPKKKIMPGIRDISSSSAASSSSDSTSSESVSETQEHTKKKRKYTDWFASPFIYEIVAEAQVWRSARIAVEKLQKKYPRLPFEPAGKFDDLGESTVRNWFDDDWKLKPQFAACMKRKHAGGRPKYFTAEIEEKLSLVLDQLRAKGKSVNSRVIALALKVVIKKEGWIVNENEDVVSYDWCRAFVKEKMGWTWRSTTTGTKLPEDWKEMGILMLKRVAVWIDDVNSTPTKTFHRSLLINLDQTGVHLVPKTKYTYAERTQKHAGVNGLGEDDKRQITAVMASSADGDLLPLQLIYQGKTQRCEVKATAQSHPSVIAAVNTFHITHSHNHWSTLETMKQYIQHVIIAYMQQKIIQHRLPADSKAIILLDCWSVHRSEEFLAYMKAQHKNIICVFIPPNCTSKLQVADTHLNFPFKRGIRSRFNDYVVQEMLNTMDKKEQIEIDLTMGTLKPLLLQWIYDTWSKMKAKSAHIMNAWEQLFSIFDPFSSDNQREAVREWAKDRWKLETKYDNAEDEEEENVYESASEDEEKDELDVMEEIRHGTRRSARVQQQRGNQQRSLMGYLVRSDQIQLDEDDLDE